MRTPLRILLAEDNPGDVLMVREALAHHKVDAQLVCVRDGEQAIRHMDAVEAGDGVCPDLVLLDLNLPRQDGRAVLRHIRALAKCQTVPVIIVTSSTDAGDRDAAFRLGANRFFSKTIDYDDAMELGAVVLEVTKPKNSGHSAD